MIKKIGCLMLLFLFTFWPMLFSQSSEEVLLHTVISSGISSSKELKILKKRIQVKETEHKIVISELLPKLNFEFDLNSVDYDVDGRDPLARINIADDDIMVFPVAPSKYSSGLELSVSQTLFAGGRIIEQIGLQGLEVRKSKLDYELLLSKKQNDLSNSYYKTLIASFEKEAVDKLVDLTEKKLEFLRRKSDQGFLTKKNLREAEIDFSNRLENQKLKKQILINAQSQLINKSGLSDSAIQLSFLPDRADKLEAFFQQLKSSANNYEPVSVKQSKIIVAIQEKKHAINKSPFMPEINLSAGIDYFDANNSFKKSFDELKHGNTYVQLSVRYNLFSGFRDTANLKKTDLEKQIAQLIVSDEQEDFHISTEKIVENAQEAIAMCKQAKKNFDSMKSLLSEALLQFDHNQISKTDIIDTQIYYAEAELLYKKASVEVEMVLSELAFQIGEGAAYLRRFEQ